MPNWFQTQYNDVKGNMKWAALAILWGFIQQATVYLLHRIPNISNVLVWGIVLIVSAAVFIWLAKSSKQSPQLMSIAQSRDNLIPTLSVLNQQAPQITFDAREWFRRAYYSPMTAEVENNIKISAEQNAPQNHEGFYARFIGVGLVSYLHDMTWAYIFKSQLVLLTELNRRDGFIPLSDARGFYQRAVEEYPKVYGDYSFEQWIDFMKSQQLLLRHPSEMLEITNRGRDFLKYLAHWGRDASVKAG